MWTEGKIPKKIHYCWFGNGEKSELAKKCIESWKKILKGYEIIEWNEENFDINSNKYVREAYDNKKYAFVSDYVRLYALYNYGGIYLDTDVEIIKNFDEFLKLKAFVGFEDEELIATAVIGSQRGNSIIGEWIDSYQRRSFVKNGKIDDLTNVRVFTNILLEHGLNQNNLKQEINGGEFVIFPTEYFSPLKFGTKKPKITSKTVSIHWFEGTWTNLSKKVKIKVILIIKTLIGFKNYNIVKQFIKGI